MPPTESFLMPRIDPRPACARSAMIFLLYPPPTDVLYYYLVKQ